MLEDEFLNEFWKYIPVNIEKKAVQAWQTSKKLMKVTGQSRLPLISLDRVYFPGAAAFLEVTRKTDPNNGLVTIAARPRCKPLQDQIREIPYEEVAVGDVGVFEGKTITEVCNALEERAIRVAELYLGFSTPEANEKLNSVRKVTALQTFNFYEWIELRDLFGIDGRAVGVVYGQRAFIPYCENLSWASILPENEPSVRELCIEYNEKLIALLKEARKEITKIGKSIKFRGKNG